MPESLVKVNMLTDEKFLNSDKLDTIKVNCIIAVMYTIAGFKYLPMYETLTVLILVKPGLRRSCPAQELWNPTLNTWHLWRFYKNKEKVLTDTVDESDDESSRGAKKKSKVGKLGFMVYNHFQQMSKIDFTNVNSECDAD